MKKIERKTSKRATSRTTSAVKNKSAADANKSVADSPDNLSLSEIKTLIELISDKQFNEFELERGNFRLRLSKGLAKVPQAVPAPIQIEQPVALSPTPTPAVATPPIVSAPVAEPAKEKEIEDLYVVSSPIVGTFYRSASPTAKPFVEIGSRIQPGTPLCIIEAMKLMNEIQSEVSGEVVKIYVENGQPVEYGQSLFGIKK